MFKDMTKRRQSANKRKGQKKGPQKDADDNEKGQELSEAEETDDGGGNDDQDDTLKNPGGLSPWEEDVWRMTGPVTDNRYRYDYHAAVITSIQLKGYQAHELPADHSDSDDPMYEFQSKRRRVTFKPRDKISKEINRTLKCYENDI